MLFKLITHTYIFEKILGNNLSYEECIFQQRGHALNDTENLGLD
jgi:hypothetical protein